MGRCKDFLMEFSASKAYRIENMCQVLTACCQTKSYDYRLGNENRGHPLKGSMSRMARQIISEIPYHIISRGNNRQWIFDDNDDFSEYLSILERYKLAFRY